MDKPVRIGDRVQTNKGPGTIKAFRENRTRYRSNWGQRLDPPTLITVQLDTGQHIHRTHQELKPIP